MIQKLSWLIVLLTLVACSPTGNVTPTIPSTPSSTLVPPAASSTATPTHINTPIRGAPVEQCVKMLPAFPDNRVPAGTLVISPPGELSLLNFREQTRRSIPGLKYTASTSPNGKWLSYVDLTSLHQFELIVESANGERQTQLTLDWSIYDWIPWLDNEQIWTGFGVELDPPTLVLNPFTGKGQELPLDYPDFAPFDAPVNAPRLHFGWSNVAYDPSLQLVVYPKLEDDGYYIALWNRETKQEIVKIPDTGYYRHLPLWFIDGSAFVIAAYPDRSKPPEWMVVSRDGKIQQLTHFGELSSRYGFDAAASISPDGRYLAFGLNNGSRNWLPPAELIILDLQTLEAVNTCMTFDSFPIWSPDSQYLAIRHWDDNKKQNSVVVLDFESGWAVTVFADDTSTNYRTTPRGWLDSGE